MTLNVKDAAAATTALKTTFASGEHTPHHNVDSLPPLPAGTNLAGAMRAYLEVGTVYIAGVAYTPRRVLFDTLSVPTLIVAPTSGKKVRVLAMHATYSVSDPLPGGFSALRLIEQTSSAPVMAPIYLPSDVVHHEILLPLNQLGWCETFVVDKALQVTLPGYGAAEAFTGEVLVIDI